MRSRSRSSTTRSSRACSRKPASGASGSWPGTTPIESRRTPPRGAHALRAPRSCRCRRRDRDGWSSSPRARRARPRAPSDRCRTRSIPRWRCSPKIPLRAGQVTHIAAPLFHSWGLAHFTLGMLLGRTMSLCASSTRRPGSAEIERTRGRGARGGAGDDAADPRAPRRGAPQVRHVVIEGGGRKRLGTAGRPGHGVDGRVRRQPLQPLRLHRGGMGHDRDARGHARRARHRRHGAARDGRQALRRERGSRCPPARPAESSWAARCCSRATRAAGRRT